MRKNAALSVVFSAILALVAVTPAGFGPGAAERSDSPRFGGAFFQPAKPIKGFVTARAKAVADQLAGKSKGETVDNFGFGGRGPGGQGGFGPGNFLGGAFMSALDANKDDGVSRDEFAGGFVKWFDAWNRDQSAELAEEELRAGINQDLAPFRGPPGGARPPSDTSPRRP